MLGHRTAAIPERPANLLADTFRNVLQQPRVGLIFVVLGKRGTPRSARRRIARDEWLPERLAVAAKGRNWCCRDGRGVVHALNQVHGALTDVAAAKLEAGGLVSIGEAMVVRGNLDISVSGMRALAEDDERKRMTPTC